MGQSQFAEALQSVLEEVADALAENNVTVFGDTKIFNGSRLRKVVYHPQSFLPKLSFFRLLPPSIPLLCKGLGENVLISYF